MRSHFLNQSWVIVNCTSRNKLHEIIIKIQLLSFRKKQCKNIVGEMAAILSRGWWVRPFHMEINWTSLKHAMHSALATDLDVLHGHCLCKWWLLLKILWWYDESNITTKAFTELLCYSWIYRPWARNTFQAQTRHEWGVFQHSRVKVFSSRCYWPMIAMTLLSSPSAITIDSRFSG